VQLRLSKLNGHSDFRTPRITEHHRAIPRKGTYLAPEMAPIWHQVSQWPVLASTHSRIDFYGLDGGRLG
jgi:hypothetical protein